MRLLQRGIHVGLASRSPGTPRCSVSRRQPEATFGSTELGRTTGSAPHRIPRRCAPRIDPAATQSDPAEYGPRLVKPGGDRRLEITLPHSQNSCPITFRRALITRIHNRGHVAGHAPALVQGKHQDRRACHCRHREFWKPKRATQKTKKMTLKSQREPRGLQGALPSPGGHASIPPAPALTCRVFPRMLSIGCSQRALREAAKRAKDGNCSRCYSSWL
jgi:hypothetical protein